MVGYPRIDEDNPYLITRFDGVIIDSKPWGHGPHKEHTFPGTTQTFPEVYELEVVSLSLHVPVLTVSCIQRRHPLAFAHFANHPPKGTLPNAMLAPFEIRTTTLVRPYVPVVKCMGQYAVMEPEEVVTGLALLAERVVTNEEIFVNYRLNPSVARPDWYSPVDEKEDQLRWT